MSGDLGTSLSSDSLDYEILEDDQDHIKNGACETNSIQSWVDPHTLKLNHRIGRGPFGDVWISTHHRAAADYDGYHEVAIKMLYPIQDDQKRIILTKFDDLFCKCHDLEDVCLLHGISIIHGKICIIMKFYEGSVEDKMVHYKGGKLPLSEALRYGIDLARGINKLHARGILVLNLKPSNFLLDEQGHAVIGDMGIPWLLLGVTSWSLDTVLRPGTPNYMAPEQWQPVIRGPVSFESDSWGFACSFVEMLSGVKPWSDRSPEDIYNLVVVQRKKPKVPAGLPPALENILYGCFQYDLRDRPLMGHILLEFSRFQNILKDNGWMIASSTKTLERKLPTGVGNESFLFKDPLQVGDSVRSRKVSYSCRAQTMDIPQGAIVGLDSNGFVIVRVPGIHDPLRVHSSAVERVTSGFAAGDWIRVKEESMRHSPVGIIHSIDRNGQVSAGFMGIDILWKGSCSDLQMAESFRVGQFVRLKRSVVSPRFEWPQKCNGEWVTGRIFQALPNGCLVVEFPGRLVFGEDGNYLADPAEVEIVSFSTCRGVVKKYQHLEDFHWAVRPLAILLGLSTALMFLFGETVPGRKDKSRSKDGNVSVQGEGQDSQNVNRTWLPSPVASILFKEGIATPR